MYGVMKLGLIGVIVSAVAIGQLAVGARALAADAQPSTPAPTTAPPSGYPPGTPPPNYPPPPPYAAPYYPGVAPNQMAFFTYEAQRKNVGIALLLEFVVPGLGSVYGDHAVGALITWACFLAGIVLIVWGVSNIAGDSYAANGARNGDDTAVTIGVLGGVVLILGGRIYGFVDAYRSTDAFNRQLRMRLGLPPGFSMGLGGVGSGSALGFGPHVRFTF